MAAVVARGRAAPAEMMVLTVVVVSTTREGVLSGSPETAATVGGGKKTGADARGGEDGGAGPSAGEKARRGEAARGDDGARRGDEAPEVVAQDEDDEGAGPAAARAATFCNAYQSITLHGVKRLEKLRG